MPVLGGDLNVLVRDTAKAVQNNHDATMGIDIKVNAKTTIGGSIAWNRSVRSATDFNRTSYTLLPESTLLFRERSVEQTNGKILSVPYIPNPEYSPTPNRSAVAVQRYKVNRIAALRMNGIEFKKIKLSM